jgi:hypothetical protein
VSVADYGAVHEFLIQGVKTEQYGDILTCLSRVNGKLLKSRLLPSENLPGLHDVYIRIRVGKGVKAKHVVEELYRHAGLDVCRACLGEHNDRHRHRIKKTRAQDLARNCALGADLRCSLKE